MGVGFAALCMLISGYLLFLAQRHIHMGGAGTFVLGIFLYGEPVRCTYELNPRMKSFQQMSKKIQYQRFNVIVAE